MAQLNRVKVDVDQDAKLAQRLGVRSISTLVLLNQGGSVASGTGFSTQLTRLLPQH